MKRKRVFRSKDRESLAARMLREGLLDVCLRSAAVMTIFGGKTRVRKTFINSKGYPCVALRLEAKGRGGKKHVEWKNGRKVVRRRHRMTVAVHRLVMMKRLAIETAGGERWRSVVIDIPSQFDVDHVDRDRSNAAASNLRLREVYGNRQRTDYTSEERERIDKEWDSFMNS